MLAGLAISSNVTLGESVSGILGLGFPRLSQIAASTPNGELYLRKFVLLYYMAYLQFVDDSLAPPILSAIAELGNLSYPLFGLSLTRDASGTLSMGACLKRVLLCRLIEY